MAQVDQRTPFLPYNATPRQNVRVGDVVVPSFLDDKDANLDPETVASFGEEWQKFDHFSEREIERMGDEYFDIIDSKHIHADSAVLDLGCGTGRWSYYLADKVGAIEAVDPSEAVVVAVKLLANKPNVRVTQASVNTLPFADESFDFLFSLGVLHHIPDTAAALRTAVKKLKAGGYMLLYLYYEPVERGWIFRTMLKAVTMIRGVVSKLPSGLKQFVSDLIATVVYLPLILLVRLLVAIFPKAAWPKRLPLAYYRDKTWNVIRNDALDRFGTGLEQRFTREEILDMMQRAGLRDVVFSKIPPYWHAVGRKVDS